MAQVGGVVDRVFWYSEIAREEAVNLAKSEAIRRVIKAGGEEAGVEVVEFEEIPLAYSSNDSVRVRVKAVSDLRTQSSGYLDSHRRGIN